MQFSEVCSQKTPLLLQSINFSVYTAGVLQAWILQGTHKYYEVSPVKMLGFYKAHLGQDLASESIKFM